MNPPDLVLLTGDGHWDGAHWALGLIQWEEKASVGIEGAGQRGWGGVFLAQHLVVIIDQAFWG